MSVNITLLKEIPFFRNLTEEELEDISNITEEIKLQKNSIIFKQGEEADAFYIILEGEIIVNKSFNDKDQKIITMSKGAIIGEMAFITDEKRTGTVKTLKNTRMLKIKKDKFKLLMEGEKSIVAYKLIYRIAQILSFRLARLGEQFVSLLYDSKFQHEEKEGFLEYIRKFLSSD